MAFKTNLANLELKKACARLGFDVTKITDTIKKYGIVSAIISFTYNLTVQPIENSKIAGAISMAQIYDDAPHHILKFAEIFRDYLRPDVYDFIVENHQILDKELVYERDFMLSYFATGTLIDSYLSRVKHDDSPKEIPQIAYMRIAVGMFSREDVPHDEKLSKIIKYFHILSNKDATAASPTFFNMGFRTGAPSSCMIFSIGDSLDDILKTIHEIGISIKNNAGVGFDLSNIRHSSIGRHGVSQGVIPLAKIWDLLTMYVNQGGRRPGAATASLRIFHIDIPEFIEMCDQTSEEKMRVQKLNTSIMFSDIFMLRVKNKEKWTMFCPKQTFPLVNLHGAEHTKMYLEMEQKAETWKRYCKYISMKRLRELGTVLDFEEEYEFTKLDGEFSGEPVPKQIDSRVMDAVDIYESICEMQRKKGMPYIVHGCSVNRKSNMMNVGPIRCSNLCQEIMETTEPEQLSSSCNLHSISLKAFASLDGFDFIRFSDTVRTLIIALNRVIAESVNVSEKIKKSNSENAPIGLGVSGFADMCAIMNIPAVDPNKIPFVNNKPDYTTAGLRKRVINPKLEQLNYLIWSCMYYTALDTSMKLARVHGPYKNFKGSPLSKGIFHFDFYKQEEKQFGRKYPFKLDPANPKDWGMGGDWETLRHEIMTYGVRNCLLLTIMPTASSAQILDNCESVEFYPQNIYKREVQSGEYPIVNPYMVNDLIEAGLWNTETYNNITDNDGSILYVDENNFTEDQVHQLRFIKEKYLTMFEIPTLVWLSLCAQRQVFVDQSSSMNLYITSPSLNQLKAIHMKTYELGLKTGMYYLRSRSSGDAIKFGREQKVAKNRQLENIMTDLNVYTNSSKMSSKEHRDISLENLMAKVNLAEERYEEEQKNIRTETISKALAKGSRPVALCTRQEGCISCS